MRLVVLFVFVILVAITNIFLLVSVWQSLPVSPHGHSRPLGSCYRAVSLLAESVRMRG
jgi:hypothetical protein